MFEDFSFSSPSSSRPPRLALDDDKPMTDCDSSMISPLSSRCPSPRSFAPPRFPPSRSLYFRSPQQQQQQQAPTSVPLAAYDHRLSIGTLTKKLHEHTIQNPSSLEQTSRPASPSSTPTPRSSYSSRFPGYVLTPPDTDHDDEGYGSPMSPSLSPQPQSPFLNPTSAPLDFDPFMQADLSVSADPIRTRRQHLSRLQVQYNTTDLDAIRCALAAAADDKVRHFNPVLTEACHPSSLPPTQGPRRRRTASLRGSRVRSPVSPDAPPGSSGDSPLRRKSVSGTGGSSHRIEKGYQTSSGRDRKKSEAGLRRKSVVGAALASMLEQGE
ncbi:hypothetical protein ASPCAL01767 [Aspergillus calidoustus]|uniref:Uncharacterized protein n=1 Tax=Aspergillus calidoustus TaxID=454130 RepID=A0A0U5GJU8_ASPCI|nr:hypothetical protein ASPCAL01767 [Aspergillus calidoustus]